MILHNPIHHIGVATRNIHQELFAFEAFGFQKEAEFIDETQGVKGIFLIPKNSNMPQYRFELLENLYENGPLSGYIQTKTKMYHIAYETKNIESDLEKLLTLNGGGEEK